MPGEKSLAANQYYAHPQNSFWKIIFSICNEEFSDKYTDRVQVLKKNQLALWDVLKSCQRSGSLDSNIVSNSSVVNDFSEFLKTHNKISKICFNGQKASQIFKRHVIKGSERFYADYTLITLPSTSPAHASMKWTEKQAAWREHIKIV